MNKIDKPDNVSNDIDSNTMPAISSASDENSQLPENLANLQAKADSILIRMQNLPTNDKFSKMIDNLSESRQTKISRRNSIGYAGTPSRLGGN